MRRLHTLYTPVLHYIHYVVLHRKCQIITQKSVNFFCSFWKKLHRTEKIYTGTARGARDKYEVCTVIVLIHIMQKVPFFMVKSYYFVLEEFVVVVLRTFPWLSLARVNLKPLSPQPLTTTSPLLKVPQSSNLKFLNTTLKTAQCGKEVWWWRGPRCPHPLCCSPSQIPKLLQMEMNKGINIF